MKKLKRVVIKEEFVALTGDFVKAVILNQLIYWSERVEDFDRFIQEEKQRAEVEGKEVNIELRKGWLYKSAQELSEETMLGLSPETIRRAIKELVSQGWISERINPQYKWDKTKQYRVNLHKIDEDLRSLGYSLQGYKSVFRIHIHEESNPHPRGIESTPTRNRTCKMKMQYQRLIHTPSLEII